MSVPGGASFADGPSTLHARVAGELAGDVDPRRLPARLRVPGVADEHRHLCLGRLGQPSLAQEVAHAGKRRCGRARVGQVPERGQHVRLAAAHLRDQRLHRSGVLGFTGEATQHEARVVPQCPREAGPREKLLGLLVVVRGGARDHLFERDGELVRVERAPFTDFFAGCDQFVPGFHWLLLKAA